MKLLGFNDMSLEVDREVLEMDRKFQKKSDEAVAWLAQMSAAEIKDIQNTYLKKIEPEEKVKIKFKEKQANKIAKKSTHEITKEMLEEQISLSDIADRRAVKPETILSHIEDLQAEANCPDVSYLKKELKYGELETITTAFEKAKTTTLAPVYNLLAKQKKRTPYLKIRLARLFLPK